MLLFRQRQLKVLLVLSRQEARKQEYGTSSTIAVRSAEGMCNAIGKSLDHASDVLVVTNIDDTVASPSMPKMC